MKKLITLFLTTALLSTIIVPKTAFAEISINIPYVTLNTNDTYTLKVVGFDGLVKWRSNHSEIATVDKDGLVKPISQGSTYVFGTAGKKEYKCLVTVTASSKDYTVYESENIKIVYKGLSLKKICFEFINKTDKDLFLKAKSFTVDDVLYEHYLYDSTFAAGSDRYWNFKPGTSKEKDTGITGVMINNISGKFQLCTAESKDVVEDIEFYTDMN